MFGGECSMFRDTSAKIHPADWLVGKNQKFPTSPNETNPNLLKILPCIKHLSSQVSRHCPAQLQPNAISRQLQCLEEPHLGHPPASVLMPHQTPQTHKSLESMDYILQSPTYQQWQHVSTNIWRPDLMFHAPLQPPKQGSELPKSRHILCLGISILSGQSIPLLSFSLQLKGYPSQKATSSPFSRPHLVKTKMVQHWVGDILCQEPLIVTDICQS